MLCHGCQEMTEDGSNTVGQCGDRRDKTRLRNWFENALGIPMLQGCELVDLPCTHGKDPIMPPEEAL